MKKYSEYKDSGVEWIGEIPSHWGVKKLKYLSDIKTGDKDTKDSVEDGIYPFFVRSDNVETINSYSFDGEAVLTAGDGVGVAKVFHYINGKFAYHQRVYKVSNFKEIDGRYFYYYMKVNFGKEVQKLSAKTTVDSLRLPMFGNFPVLIPPDGGKEIVKYLDNKTSQIENLISKKEELIEILKSSKTKLISETVTKGLDKHVPMKDSGVECIGDIPEHWDIKRLKFICNVNPQKSEVRLSKYSNVSFLPMENVSLNTLILDTEKELADVYNGYTYFKDGDIVFAKVTPCFENGNMAIAKNLTNGVGFGSTELNVLRVNENIIDREFLYYVIQSDKFKNEAIANMYGVAGLKRISTKFIEDYKVLLPSIEEQRKIIEFLNLKTNYIDHIVSKTQEQIELLKKAKQKLITEVVTGKIDVTSL